LLTGADRGCLKIDAQGARLRAERAAAAGQQRQGEESAGSAAGLANGQTAPVIRWPASGRRSWEARSGPRFRQLS